MSDFVSGLDREKDYINRKYTPTVPAQNEGMKDRLNAD